ncbi:MAG: D-tyrosyl-tRNA(Tyr) deacylase [Deltaproteobacteria bacterium]|nr:D-tyrosyl-tRNA(Tyr) deacylase [Deltaproteobacteria bacterium]
MRVVIQRVREAEVTVAGESVGRIGTGLLVLAGLGRDDGESDVAWMARKIVGLRLFDDPSSSTQRSVIEADGELLAISQFTLLADCGKGRRPSYDRAMAAGAAAALFARFVDELRARVRSVASGRFGAHMHVRFVNDGPLTLVVDSPVPGSSC